MTEVQPMTERQRKLISFLQDQLDLSDAELDELALQHTLKTRSEQDRRCASAPITELQRLRQEGI